MILIDSGILIALFVNSDAAHESATLLLASNTEAVRIPSFVVAEVGHFVGDRAYPKVEADFLRSVGSGRFVTEDPVRDDYLRAADLVEQYADFALGTVDALIVAMAERLRVTTLYTLDRRHFGAVRPAHCESFVLVP